MIIVIKSENCSRCDMICEQFTSKNIPYKIAFLDDFDDIIQDEILEIADKLLINSYPLLYNDETKTLMTYKEILNVFKSNL